MKANKKFVEDNAGSSHIADIIFIMIVVGLCAMLVTVQVGKAIIPILIGMGVAFFGGALVGWWLSQQQDTGTPDALVTSETDYVLSWNDFLEEWNNSYISENTHLRNYMNTYNFTYLQNVRRAENEVSAFVNYTDWDAVVENMTTLTGYKENVTYSIIGMLHCYNRLEANIISYLFDTMNFDYTQPIKQPVRGGPWYAINAMSAGSYQYKLKFGTFPAGYTGKYSIGDSLYITFIYVPDGKYILLNRTVNGLPQQTNYSAKGVYDLQGMRCEVVDVSRDANYGTSLDGTQVYVWGMPVSFNPLTPPSIDYTIISVHNGTIPSGANYTMQFGCKKYIDFVGLYTWGGDTYKVYVDGVLFANGTVPGGARMVYNVSINDNVTILTTQCTGHSHSIHGVRCPGYFYNIWHYCEAVKITTTHDGTVYVHGPGNFYLSRLTADRDIGLYWMSDSYVNIYDAMIQQSHILWNLYHANGWYHTTDIPSDFIVVPPDVIFDNLDALSDLPLNVSQAIYYAWMYQLIRYYDENPNSTAVYSDNNQTMYDLGIKVNATLVHGVNTPFTGQYVYVSPLLNDFHICKGEYYNLTQGLFIFNPDTSHVYYAYAGDNFTVHNITLNGVQVDCITLGHDTMSEYLLGEYGFNLSFAGEWEFPEVGYDDTYLMLAGVAIAIGIVMFAFGRFSKEKHGGIATLGLLLMIAGFAYIAYIYAVAPILQFFGIL